MRFHHIEFTGSRSQRSRRVDVAALGQCSAEPSSRRNGTPVRFITLEEAPVSDRSRAAEAGTVLFGFPCWLGGLFIR